MNEQFLRQDLSIIRDVRLLRGSTYFELSNAEKDGKPVHWHATSVFLDPSGFDYFHWIYAKSLHEFDYYGFNRYDRYEMGVLIFALEEFVSGVTAAKSIAELAQCFPEHVASRIGAEGMEHAVLGALLADCGRAQMSYAKQCLETHGYLYVLGL